MFSMQAQVNYGQNVVVWSGSQIKEINVLPSSLNSSIITDDYIDEGSKIRHIYMQQTINEIPVKGAYLSVHLLENQIIATGNNYLDKLKIQQKTLTNQKISEAAAVVEYADYLGINLSAKKIKKTDKNVWEAEGFAKGSLTIEKAYQYLNDELKLIWNVSVHLSSNGKWMNVSVDAINGNILDEESWTYECGHQHDSPSFIACKHNHNEPIPKMPVAPNEYHVFASPIESPLHGTRTYVNAPWNSATNASPIGWHNDGTTSYIITRGNNFYAREDTTSDDSGYSPSSATLDFDFPFMFGAQPYANMDAGITNAFYWGNLMHDVWYQYGFNELSGNFQNDNFGNGGLGNDFIVLDTRDGGTLNNGAFSSPPDGFNGYMELYHWTGNRSYYLNLSTPSSLAGYYWAMPGLMGLTVPPETSPISADIELADDGTANPTFGCNPLINDLTGKIALVDRGNCAFQTKVKNAQDAGALACIVCNSIHGGPTIMTGTDPTITIPSVMISLADCQNLKAALAAGQTLSAQLAQFSYNPLIDASFDNGIIAHEYGHGISNRLTGGPSTNCLGNVEQMGEGWSDWFALIMTIENGDLAADIRGISTYAAGQSAFGGGIRPAPYTSNISINGYTYGDLCNPEISVPHGVGFIWGTMLWDLTWAFIAEYGFDPDLYNGTGGNNMVMQLVIDGMKLQPCFPGFIDGRDAILLADQLNYSGANEELIWRAFADRGLGYSAFQGSSNSHCDGEEAFDMPPQFIESVKISKQVDLAQVAEGDTLVYTIIVRNDLPTTESNIVVTDSLDLNLVYQSAISNQTVSENNNVVSYTIPQLLSGEQDTTYIKTSVIYGLNSISLFDDDMENGGANWLVSNGSGVDEWDINGINPCSGDSAWYAINSPVQTDQYLTMNVLLDAAEPYLLFKHFYNTERNWDGGVVEISLDYGATWSDLGNDMISNGYNGTIEINPDSAISGRQAFTGQSFNYLTTVVDLTPYAGQVAFIRFRFATDAFVSADGWYVDDVKVFGGTYIPNYAYSSSNFGALQSNLASSMVVPATDNHFKVKVLFEGYTDVSNGLMSTEFVQQGLLPTGQPFSVAPNNYTGTETTATYPFSLFDITDWVLISLRAANNPSQIIEQQAALIRNDGVIFDVNGNEGVFFASANPNFDYYISIIHRGHLQVHTANALRAGQSIDFTTAVSQAAGNGQMKLLSNGLSAMYAGDFDWSGVINNIDYNEWASQSAAVAAYLNFDADGNAIINNIDYNLWYTNRSKVGIPNP